MPRSLQAAALILLGAVVFAPAVAFGAISEHRRWDDRDDVVAVFDETGAIVERYTYDVYGVRELVDTPHPPTPSPGGEGEGEPRSGCPNDLRGDVVAVFDETGAIVERYTYDVYGVRDLVDAMGDLCADSLVGICLSSVGNERGYAGLVRSRATGFYDARARWYAPQLRQWIEPDPLGYADSLNRWLFNLGDPINFVDPFGLDAAPTVPDEPPGDDDDEEEGGITHDDWEKAYCELFPSLCPEGTPPTEEELNDEEEKKILLVAEIVGAATPADEAIEIAVCLAQGDALCAALAILPMSHAILGWARHADDARDLARRADELGDGARHTGNGAGGNGPGGDGPGGDGPGGGPGGDGPGGAGGGGPPTGGTYTLSDPETGQVRRTGRTNDLDRRRGEHGRHPETRGLEFRIDRETDSYPAQRGREQRIHDAHPEADLNRRRPISPTNPRRDEYLREGDKL